MRQTEAGGSRWDVKVTDNTNRNALYAFQGSLSSFGAAASGWELSGAAAVTPIPVWPVPFFTDAHRGGGFYRQQPHPVSFRPAGNSCERVGKQQ